MDSRLEQQLSRRRFLELGSTGIGTAALATLFSHDLLAQGASATPAPGGLPGLPHFAPKAKRIIYLFQSGARRSTSFGTTNQGSKSWSGPSCHRRCVVISG